MSAFEGQVSGWLYGPAVTEPAPSQSGMVDAASDQAIAALVAQYTQPLYRVAFSVLRNAAEAEDAVQETFLRVLKNKNKLPEVRDARVWLVRITWNVVLDRKRRSKVRPETDDIADLARTLPCSGHGSETATIAAAEYRRILGLIDMLPGKERAALLLSAVEEMTTVEIAAVLATSESSVRSRLYRARRLLAKLLEGESDRQGVGAARNGGAR
jgi:RNA polymerase sigma-70 factor (ECF subfamily)